MSCSVMSRVSFCSLAMRGERLDALESLIKRFVSHVSQVLGCDFFLVVPAVESSLSGADGPGERRARVGAIW